MALINCPECGNSISDKIKMCPHCGVNIEDLTFCENCNHLINPTDVKCPNCNTPTPWARICPECGKGVSVTNETCPQCGFNLINHFGRVGTIASSNHTETPQSNLTEESVVCPECGFPLNGDERNCPECGLPLNGDERNCPECRNLCETIENNNINQADNDKIISDSDWANYIYECGVIMWNVFRHNYAKPYGRASRREFWSFLIIALIIWLFVRIEVGVELSAVVFVILLIPLICVAIRRMHDIDRRGWWIWVPFAFIFMYLKKSDEEENSYGMPKPAKDMIY